MTINLHPKIKKCIYELSHSRYLQKSHTIAQLGAATLLAFNGGFATYLIEGGGELNKKSILFYSIITATIISFFYVWYRSSKRKRIEVIDKITSLNSKANKL